MIVSPNNKVVRFAYGKNPPAVTSICNLFWRCMGKIALIAALLLTLVGVLWSLYEDWLGYLWFTGMLVAACVAWGIIFKWIDEWKGPEIASALSRFFDRVSDGAMTVNNSLFMQGLYAIKHKVCPIVRIEP